MAEGVLSPAINRCSNALPISQLIASVTPEDRKVAYVSSRSPLIAPLKPGWDSAVATAGRVNHPGHCTGG
jgi:hypothetical protein